MVLLLVLTTSFFSCNDEQKPIEVSFEELLLEETSCFWIRIADDRCNISEVIVINSNEELISHITCSSHFEIDFSQYTLLLARGVRCYQDRLIYVSLQQTSAQSYIMTVDFVMSLAAALKEWQVAILVDKLPKGSNVKLKGGNVIF